jgi:quinol monooxygenase YgiN
MIVVSGVMTFSPSIHDRVVERARTLTAETLKEPRCRTYGFWADPDVPGRFRVFEEWDSQEALTEHFAAPHFSAFGQNLNEGDHGNSRLMSSRVEMRGVARSVGARRAT